MKKVFCDLCRKEITRTDIPTTLELIVGGKRTEIDFHSHCYYKFMRALKEATEEAEE